MKNSLQKFNYLLSWISFLVFLSASSYAQVQQFEWVKSIGDASSIIHAYSVTTDSKGNVYSAGRFSGTVDFDPGPGILDLDGDYGMYITKMNSAGQLIWAKAFTGKDGRPQNIAVDKEGNVYTTGYFQKPSQTNPADFDPGPDTFYLYCDFIDIFVSKLDSNGNFVWAVQLNGDDGKVIFNQGYQLNVEEPGAVYVTGGFGGTVDFDPGLGTQYITTPAYQANIFVCKLNASDGSLNWAKSVASESKSVGTGIVKDELHNIYITGTFAGVQDFDPDPLDTFEVTSTGARNSFVLKLDSSGNFKWMKQLGGVSGSSSNISEGWEIAIWRDRLYVTGKFQGVMDFDPGNDTFALSSNFGKSGSYVWSLDTSGDFRWARMIEGDDDNGGMAISADNYGNVYIIGDLKGTADFNPGSPFPLSAINGTDVFIAKFQDSGDFIWAGQVGHFRSSTAGLGSYNAMDLDIDGSGNLYVTAAFGDTADFDPGPGTYTVSPTGSFAVFVLKLGCNDTTSSSINATTCSQYELNGVSYTQSGTYTQVVPNPAGCDSTITLNLTIDPVNTGVTPGSGQLKANWNDAAYQWLDCSNNSVIPGATAQTFVPVSPGDYAVIVTKHGCSDTSDCFSVMTGINDVRDGNGFFLYPNPVDHTITLDVEPGLNGGTCQLFNNLGQVVWLEKDLYGKRFSFDMSSLEPGVYVMEVISGDRRMKRKLIKL